MRLLPLKTCANFLVASSENEQQMSITYHSGRDRALPRRRELVTSSTQMMVADEFSDGKQWVDLSEEELLQVLKMFVGIELQQTGTSDREFCRYK